MKSGSLLTVILVVICAVSISAGMRSFSPVIKIVTGIIGVICGIALLILGILELKKRNQ
jgi:type IV secretory pathway VirB2 component (pilin)